ncbi:HdeD family acid-resistance protein [Calothrix sp. PCC 6303]|uniref:HdeD family acid-resistance protein n=1 Tax=Calothrix sp. PCC 6303 TaxID=1170562 RepID=UPI00030D2ADD|nr:DUF308 domain-containing protein [Calothrix sp. PCC 6303]
MRVIEPEIDEQVVSSGWTTAIPLVAVGIAILMIVLGIIAIVFPFFAGVASTLLFGWIFIFAGITQIAYAFQSRGAGKVIGKLILGLLYLLSGIFLVVNPFQGVSVGYYHFCARPDSSGVGEASPYGESHFKCAGFHLTGD